MYKKKLFVLFGSFLLISCNGVTKEGQEDFDKNAKINMSHETVLLHDNFDINGKYATDNGELEIVNSEGIVYFKLLVVNSEGRTGEAEGELIVESNVAIYEAENCKLKFAFTDKKVTVTQKGMCEMGLNVTASGVYKSITEHNSLSVIGKVGDYLGSLFYSESESIYKKYCEAGMEENSGNIMCKARNKSGTDSADIAHTFSGIYEGTDGELPPLSVAKKYKILSTNLD